MCADLVRGMVWPKTGGLMTKMSEHGAYCHFDEKIELPHILRKWT